MKCPYIRNRSEMADALFNRESIGEALDMFMAHVVTCPDCWEEIKTTELFKANLKAVHDEEGQ